MIDSDRERALDALPGLREIASELDIYADLLRRWQSKVNLIGRSTLPQVWWRHFADSMQVCEIADTGSVWTDLGSGAGFPGLVVALVQSRTGKGVTHLIEADQRKAAFLREVSRETGANAVVHCARVEAVLPSLKTDLISSRAMASLRSLFGLTREHVENGATAIFFKGRDVVSELTEASIPCNFVVSTTASRIDRDSCLVQIRLRR